MNHYLIRVIIVTRYQKVARRAVDAYLREHASEESIMLWTLSVVADEAACNAGRKSELFLSLFDYLRVLPPGTRSDWVGERGIGGTYRAFNPYYHGPRRDKTYVPIPGPFDIA